MGRGGGGGGRGRGRGGGGGGGKGGGKGVGGGRGFQEAEGRARLIDKPKRAMLSEGEAITVTTGSQRIPITTRHQCTATDPTPRASSSSSSSSSSSIATDRPYDSRTLFESSPLLSASFVIIGRIVAIVALLRCHYGAGLRP